IGLDLFDHPADLVYRLAAGPMPRPPLSAVDRTELSVCVRPLVPDSHPVLVEVADVCVSSQKPEQLVDDRLQMKLLRSQQRETFAEIEPHLIAKGRKGAGPGAVALWRALREDVLDEIQILPHLFRKGILFSRCAGINIRR